MWRFILGVMVGFGGAVLFRRAQSEEAIEKRFAEMQERATSVLSESRRILEETRHELGSALEAGRRSLETKAERFRRAVSEEEQGRRPGEGAGGEHPQGPSR